VRFYVVWGAFQRISMLLNVTFWDVEVCGLRNFKRRRRFAPLVFFYSALLRDAELSAYLLQ
jgi:hypothetical protein